MTGLGLAVADYTDNSHAIELSEGIRHTSFLLELVLAQVAPCLKVIRVAAVLDKAGQSGLPLKHVLTNNSGDQLAVFSTANHHRVSRCHVSSVA